MNITLEENAWLEMARKRDLEDPLRAFRDEFLIDDSELIYLDGNSLGRLPKRTIGLMSELVEKQWGERLVRGWGEHWIDLPKRLGGKIGELIGAQSDEVLVCDSTSVNFYKLVMAALESKSGRSQIVTDSANFPSDIYLLQGCCKQTGHTLTIVEPEAVYEAIGNETALLTLSHTAFKSGLVQPMDRLTGRAHSKGALVLWDLSHSVGAMPIDLNACQADLAVGCTYKYLNGGPGAPAFLYVRKDRQDTLLNPIWGWFGQKEPFAFGLEYSPAGGIQRFMTGTPTILSMAAVESGVDLVLEAGINGLRHKSVEQTEFLIDLWKRFLVPQGVTLNSPTRAEERGSHISFGHRHGFQIDQTLINDLKVIPDFRHPDNIRFGVTPLSTTFEELVTAVLRLRQVIENRLYERYPPSSSGVT